MTKLPAGKHCSSAADNKLEHAGPVKELDRLANVMSIEWSGSDVLVYTQPDAQGRPFRVYCLLPPVLLSVMCLCSLLRIPPTHPYCALLLVAS